MSGIPYIDCREASEALERYRCVHLISKKAAYPELAGDIVYGITKETVLIGEDVNIQIFGRCYVTAAGAFSAGEYVKCADNLGRVGAAGSVLTMDTGPANSGLYFTSKLRGYLGDTINVELDDPAGNDQPLVIGVTDKTIHIDLATGPAGAITSTAAAIKAALDATPAAFALVSTAVEGTGLGVVVADGPHYLTGGAGSIGVAFDDAAALGDEVEIFLFGGTL